MSSPLPTRPAPVQPDQAELFPELQERQDESLVERVKHKAFVHTGAFISRQDHLCRAIVSDLLNGVSRRVIAERYSVSRNSVNAIREILDARGELEPLKKELARRLDRCVIYSLENLEEALCAGEIAKGSLPIALGILLDKKAALEGVPTARIEHITSRKVTHEELNSWLESLPSAAPAAGSLVEHNADPAADPGASDTPSAAGNGQVPGPEAANGGQDG